MWSVIVSVRASIEEACQVSEQHPKDRCDYGTHLEELDPLEKRVRDLAIAKRRIRLGRTTTKAPRYTGCHRAPCLMSECPSSSSLRDRCVKALEALVNDLQGTINNVVDYCHSLDR